jgi:hypothetical protein
VQLQVLLGQLMPMLLLLLKEPALQQRKSQTRLQLAETSESNTLLIGKKVEAQQHKLHLVFIHLLAAGIKIKHLEIGQ